MPSQEVMTIKDMVFSVTWDQLLIEATSTRIYVEVMRNYKVFSGIVFFWIGCNIGSFLNVCIYRLPLGMSLFRPKSHCPKCNHKLSWYENIPIFSYLCLCGACKECGDSISPRYIIVETLTGLLFLAVYLKVAFLGLPLLSMFLLFYVVSVAVCCAFTDCDLRVIPNPLTIPAMIVVPLYFLFHNGFVPFAPDWNAFGICLVHMAGAALVLAGFTYGGKLLFKRDAFGWGDVKYLTVIAGAFGWFPTILILLSSSVAAIVYMPVYWCFRPKRKHRGFAFAPFITIAVIVWTLFGEKILRMFVLYFRNDIR